MKFFENKIKGLYLIEPEPREDIRGYFFRDFCLQEILKATGMDFQIKQINLSLSKNIGTLRGLHFQKAPNSEDKIVQCLQGKIFDVALDLRENSPTFGQWEGQELSAENKKMLLLPKGFAHGFLTMENNCLVQYFLTEFYSPESEKGIRYDDPMFAINWPIKPEIISEKDKNWLLWSQN